MSFHRSKYASLKDAFGISSFVQEIKEKEYEILQPQQVEIVAEPMPVSFENFEEEEDMTCEKVAKHCKSCSCQRHHSFGKNMFAEFLNFLLICILIWILVYRPKMAI